MRELVGLMVLLSLSLACTERPTPAEPHDAGTDAPWYHDTGWPWPYDASPPSDGPWWYDASPPRDGPWYRDASVPWDGPWYRDTSVPWDAPWYWDGSVPWDAHPPFDAGCDGMCQGSFLCGANGSPSVIGNCIAGAAYCCVGSAWPGYPLGACIPASYPASCDFRVRCVGPENCVSGERCCGPIAGHSETYCAMSACPGPTLCQVDADCPLAGQVCCDTATWGYPYRVCAAGPTCPQ
jgi:hypothetical protein